MKNKKFRYYYLLTFFGILLVSFYPIYMGVTVVTDMIRFGTVYAEDYPKYIIPYTPIALAVITGFALMPLLFKHVEKFALAAGTVISTAMFFAAEFLLERMVTVTHTVIETVVAPSKLEDWQMYMCAYFPGETEERTLTEVDVLMGEYSPAFKMHFYIISVVLILSLLNCFYGFAKMIRTGDTSRKKTLILQSIASVAFLGMCIWACFTAFYRTGEIFISPLSAVLMTAFFILFGVTAGTYTVSFTMKRRPLFSVLFPAAVASAITLVMYIGEMILLSGHLYRFGTGFFFDGITGIVFAPVDIAVILASGAVTALIANAVREK